MATPFEELKKGLDSLGEFFTELLLNIGSILQWLNPLSEEFFLNGLFTFLGDALSYINPFDENFILKDVISFLSNMLSYINPFSENFLGRKLIELLQELFEFLFIPSQDHFGDLHIKFKEKIGFIDQLSELVHTLFNSPSTFAEGSSNTPPNWSITFYGVTVNIIDWTILERYRGFLHGLIIFIMWGSYAIRLYKRIPMIIYSYTDK